MSSEAPSISSIVRPALLEKVRPVLLSRRSTSTGDTQPLTRAESARALTSQERKGGTTAGDYWSTRSLPLIPEHRQSSNSINMSSTNPAADIDGSGRISVASDASEQAAVVAALAEEQMLVAKAAEEQAKELEEAQSAAAKAEEQALQQRQEMDQLRVAAEKEAEEKKIADEKERAERLAKEAEEAEAALDAIQAEEEARLAREEEELKLALKLEEAKAELEAKKAQEEQDRALAELQAASMAAKKQLAYEDLNLDLEPKNRPEEEEEEEEAKKEATKSSTESAPSETPAGESTGVGDAATAAEEEATTKATSAEPTEEKQTGNEPTTDKKPETEKEEEKKENVEEKKDQSIRMEDTSSRKSTKEESIHMVRMMLKLQDKEDRRSSAMFHKLDLDKSGEASHEEMADFLAANHSLWTMLSLNFGLSKEQSTRIAAEVAMVLATGCDDRTKAMQQQLSKAQFKEFRKKYIVDKAGAQEFYFRAVFATFDKDKNNALCEEELDAFLNVFYMGGGVFEGPTALELPPKRHLHKLLMSQFDTKQDKLITLEDIQQIIKMADGSVSKLALTDEMTAILEDESERENVEEPASAATQEKSTRVVPEIRVVDEEKEESDFCDWLERSFTPPEKQTKEKMGYCRKERPCIIL